jgi:RNA polymerase sigma-70 factor (ECF subfamily)
MTKAPTTTVPGSLAPAPRVLVEVRPLVFDDVYERHIDYIWRVLRRLGVPARSLPDAAQDVLVVVHRRLGSFDGRVPVQSWLAGICVRVARQEYRTRRRRQPDMLDSAGWIDVDSLPDGASLSSTAMERGERIRLLYELMASLDAPKREVFVLAELEQMTGPEIAEILGLPLNTVYSRLREARLRFERELARRDAETRRVP